MPAVRRRKGEDWQAFYTRRQKARDEARARWNVAYDAWRKWYYDPANEAERQAARERQAAEARAREAERRARAEASAIHHRETFDDWPQFVAAACERPSDMADWQRHSREGGSWGDLIDWQTAVTLARDGWAEGAERLADMTARLEGRLANRAAVQVPGYSPVGPGVLDMGRYLIGHPEPFMVWQDGDESTETSTAPRVLKLIVAGTSSHNVSAESIYWRGAAAIAIVDMAERAGARVEVELVERISNSGHADGAYVTNDTEARITLKRAQDHVSTELLAFALANQATLRRLAFSYWETLGAAERRALGIGGHYGFPSDTAEAEREGAIYLPAQLGGAGPFYSPESTAKWVIDTLAAAGIEVEGVSKS